MLRTWKRDFEESIEQGRTSHCSASWFQAQLRDLGAECESADYGDARMLGGLSALAGIMAGRLEALETEQARLRAEISELEARNVRS